MPPGIRKEKATALHKYLKTGLVYLISICFALQPITRALADGAQIVPDGRTGTNLSISATVTDITTTTVQGGNAFNSFSKFDVNRGNTVNLHVPDTAQNLINLVRDRRTNIDGVLNAYKGGQIGGNVHILNPNGIVIGKSGVVNVGALSLQTPTRAFLDSVLSPGGKINSSAVSTILNDPTKVPISKSGLISVDGTINAPRGVRFHGHNVSVRGNVNVGHSAFVNLKGLKLRGAVRGYGKKRKVRRKVRRTVRRIKQPPAKNLPVTISKDIPNSIGIFAESDVTLSGALNADGAGGQKAGAIEVRAKRNITIARGAKLSAKGIGANSDGGDIVIFADVRTDFNAGAMIDVSGGGISGDGGFAEVSAKKVVGLNGGEFRAGATKGRAGHVLIDPEHIDQTTDLINRDGSQITLQADETIIVRNGVTIATRNVAAGTATNDVETAASIGNSGNITLEAKRITLEDNAKLLAHADSGFLGGRIRLEATDTNQSVAFSETNATISIGAATVTGALIEFIANSDSSSTLFANNDIFTDSETRPVGGFFGSLALSIPTVLAGIELPVSVAVAKADVSIATGANIRASADLNIDVDASSDSEGVPAEAMVTEIFNPLRNPFTDIVSLPEISVLYGHSAASANANVAVGAQLTVGGNLDVSANTQNELDASVLTATRQANKVLFTVAVGVGSSEATAVVDDGATVDLGTTPGSVSVTAGTEGRYATNAMVLSLNGEEGSVGTTIAVGNYTDKAEAKLGADVTAANVEVKADTRVAVAKSTASTGVGNGLLTKFLGFVAPASTAGDALKGQVSSRLGAALGTVGKISGTTTSSPIPLQFAGAVSVMVNTHESIAEILPGTSVKSDGDVKVEATTRFVDKDIFGDEFDGNLQNYVEASGEGDTSDNTTSIVLALPITVTNVTSRAVIGAAAIVDARGDIDVKATSSLPNKENWAKWQGLSTIGQKINTNLGLINGFVNTGSRAEAGAGGGSDDKSFAFAANATITTIDVETDAIISEDAEINQDIAYRDTNQDVTVEAQSTLEGVHLNGNVGILGVLPGTDASTGIGMSLGLINYDTRTHATIADRAKVHADNLVTVKAESKEVLINVGISSSYKGGDMA